MKKTIINLVLTSFIFAFSSASSLAAPVANPYIGQDLGVAKCLSQGNNDFILFLQALLFSEGLVDSAIQPWIDVFGRNQCHSGDILNLLQQQNKIRDQIRNAFLTCSTNKIQNLKRAHLKTRVEIYYVRNLVSVNSSTVGDNSGYKVLPTPQEKLYADMQEKYVGDDKFNKKDFDDFFKSLALKYSERYKQYISCENDSWKQVSLKWKEFIDSLGGTKRAAEQFKKGVVGSAEKIVETAERGTLMEYITGVVNLNINNLSSQEGFEQIVENLGTYVPSFDDSPTRDRLLEGLGISTRSYELKSTESEMLNEYKVLYYDLNDQSIQAFSEELDNLNKAVVDSLPTLSGVTDCSKMINSRQCPATK